MTTSWVEAATSSRKSFSKRFGIVSIRIEETRDGAKYHCEISILGCVVQTGTYRGALEEVKEQSHQSAITLFRRALKDLGAKKSLTASQG